MTSLEFPTSRINPKIPQNLRVMSVRKKLKECWWIFIFLVSNLLCIIRVNAIKCLEEGLEILLIIHLALGIVLVFEYQTNKTDIHLWNHQPKRTFCLPLNNTVQGKFFKPFLNLIKARLSVSCESNLYDSFLSSSDPPQDLLNTLHCHTQVPIPDREHNQWEEIKCGGIF